MHNRREVHANTKPFKINKREVFQAWKRVKANKGAGGIDGEDVAAFEARLSDNLYRLWNRMSSGSYFPQAVKRVEIPKKDGSTRPLGIPTVYDRVGQEIVRARLERNLEPLFHKDSYGYRPGKSAIDAVRVCCKRSWQYAWALDVDIEKFFDTIDHELLLKAVRKHCPEKWMVLYIERWLKAPVQEADGKAKINHRGTPQGGVISPLLANLYMHYVFDKWMEREYPQVKFERYADDIVCHCKNKEAVLQLENALSRRLADCKLRLHRQKTKIVYCKKGSRNESHPNVSYTFLGYTFQPRAGRNKTTKHLFLGFMPAVSRGAEKAFRARLKAKGIRRHGHLSVNEVAESFNPMIRGWFGYFRHFSRTELYCIYMHIDWLLTKWARAKYRWGVGKAYRWLKGLKRREPKLFAHWDLLKTHG